MAKEKFDKFKGLNIPIKKGAAIINTETPQIDEEKAAQFISGGSGVIKSKTEQIPEVEIHFSLRLSNISQAKHLQIREQIPKRGGKLPSLNQLYVTAIESYMKSLAKKHGIAIDMTRLTSDAIKYSKPKSKKV